MHSLGRNQLQSWRKPSQSLWEFLSGWISGLNEVLCSLLFSFMKFTQLGFLEFSPLLPQIREWRCLFGFFLPALQPGNSVCWGSFVFSFLQGPLCCVSFPPMSKQLCLVCSSLCIRSLNSLSLSGPEAQVFLIENLCVLYFKISLLSRDNCNRGLLILFGAKCKLDSYEDYWWY